MSYKGQVHENALKRKVVVSVSNAQYAVLQARADAQTYGNIAQYIRTQVFGEGAEASGAKGGSPEPSAVQDAQVRA